MSGVGQEHDAGSSLDLLRRELLLRRLQRANGDASFSGKDLRPIVRVDRSRPMPLSYAQQRLWFLDQLEGAGVAYAIPVSLRLQGSLDRGALQAALDTVVSRHEILRTTFTSADDGPVQLIAAQASFALKCSDLSEWLQEEREAELRRLAVEEARAPFNLSTGPLIRGQLVRLDEQEHVLFVTMHHIVSDGWSMGVLIREVAALYVAYRQGRPDPLPPLAIQYVDYAVWQRSWLEEAPQRSQLEYWREQLASAPALLELPTDRPRPAMQSYDGARVRVDLDRELVTGLRELGKRHGATLYMVLYTAWAILLSKLSSQDEFVIGAPVANRRRSEVEGLIGFFVNTLALRVRLDSNQSIGEHLDRVKAMTLAAFSQQDVPFDQVVEAVQPRRSLSYAPLFQTMLVLQNAPQEALELPGLKLTLQDTSRGTAQFDLTLWLTEVNGGITGELEYAGDLFERETIERWSGYFQTLLRSMVVDAGQRIGDLVWFGAQERLWVLKGLNATQAEYPSAVLVHELFEQQVAKTPGAIALVYEQRQLSYDELNRRANQLAHYLVKQGVGPDELVAICMERSIEMVVGLLGILKAGGAYVPLDPSFPRERLGYLLEDARPRWVLTQGSLRESLPETETTTVCLDLAWNAIAGEADDNLDAHALGLRSDQLAYVIYTSGSTGEPKGVMNEHGGLVNRLHWMQVQYGLGSQDRVLQKTPYSFDVSVWEFFWPLLNGAGLVMARPRGHQDPGYLSELIEQAGITVVHFVPSMLRVFLEHAKAEQCRSLVHVVCSGEELSWESQQRCFERLPWVRLHNLYGPTEAAIDVTYWECRAEAEATRIPIGRPISNTQIYLLDQSGQLVPRQIIGEIHIGGKGVARGYLNRPELTAERFVRDPFSSEPQARMYKTGDLGRWRSDGNIEYLGRNDHQVKIRGFRIELGEIETVLQRCEGVREAVVLLREDTPDDQRLVAYLTAKTQVLSQELSIEALRAQLRTTIPEHMIPSAYVVLPALPLTANGKLDRKALPEPEQTAYLVREYASPRGETEVVLAEIWQDVLKVERVGRRDNFFELGGHSLLATQVVARIRQRLQVEVPLRELFEHSILERLANRLQDAQATDWMRIERADRNQPLALSFAQQRLWFLDQLSPGGLAYHIPGAVRLRGALDVDALRRVLDTIVARHEVLRTVFIEAGGEAVQRITREGSFSLSMVDFAGSSDLESQAQRCLAEEAQSPFDLARGPLIRGVLIRLAAEEHLFGVTMHHIISDGWSIGVLLRELSQLYNAYRQGKPSPLAELPIQYADYAQWQRQWLQGEVLQRQLAYWRERLEGAPTRLELPTDRPRPAVLTHRGGVVSFELGEALSDQLKTLSRRHEATLFMTLAAAWNVLLSRYSGQDDINVGYPVANRNRAEVEGLIGFFVNTLVLRTQLTGEERFEELLARVREAVLDADAHQELPFEKLVEELNPQRSQSHTPLFQVMLALNNATADERVVLPGLQLSALSEEGVQATAKFELTLSLRETQGRLLGALEYNVDLFDRDRIERMVKHYEVLLEGIIADPAAKVNELPLLTVQEREQVLRAFNATAAAYPREKLIHELFEEHVDRSPDTIALAYEEERLTYAELNGRANQLARYLVKHGVGPDELVAICMERSIEMVVGLLGILKAGGAYVPLDSTYPRERLGYLLEDARPRWVLTQADLRDVLPETEATTICLDLDSNAIAWEADDNLDARALGLRSDHLAYLIYTSGSTGSPKGVMIEHRNTGNLIAWAKDVFNKETFAHTLFSTSLNFDLSVFECFVPLCSGQSIRLVSSVLDEDQGCRDVTLVNTVPSAATALASRKAFPSTVRTINLAGEVLKQALVEQLFAMTPATAICNLYGPSETTTYSTWARMTREEGFVGHIGRPISNTHIYILDGSGQPVPLGVVGGIYIGGEGVARGYLNRPELTAERFVRDPFSGKAGSRMYKTGDLGRWRSDGNIEYLGRNDHQVKMRGYRIELGEIESVLQRCEGVQEAVVLLREDTPGGQRLVAYLTVETQERSIEHLRTHLSAILPEYMIPSAYVVLDALPLTPHGKIDRKALPAPELEAYGVRKYEAPQGETETVLAEIWSEVLKVERVGRHDSFFELGGHSLLATQAVSRIRQRLQVEVPLREFFEHSVMERLAKRLEVAHGSDLARIDPADRGELLALSFAQQRLWFLDQLEGPTSAYHIAGAVRLRGELDVAALQRALDTIVARHDVLRTVFIEVGGEPVQRIAPEGSFSLRVMDLGASAEQEREVQRRIAEEAQSPFDLARGPLIRGVLIRLVADEHLLAVTMHHIVSDGWSIGVLLRELSQLYSAYQQGKPPPLAELPIQYVDYARWQRQRLPGEVLQRQLAYWRERLEGAPTRLELPTDRPRPAMLTHRGGVVPFELGETLSQRLKELSRCHEVTLFMMLAAALNVLLSRYSGQDDISVGYPVANRNRAEVEGLIGCFVNTLVLRTRFEGEERFEELLQSVKGAVLDADAHQDVPFEKLVEELNPQRSQAHTPLFQVMLALNNATADERVVLPGLELGALSGDGWQQTTKFELTVSLRESEGRLVGALEYNADLFDRQRIERMVKHYEVLLAGIVSDPRTKVKDLPLLTVQEREQVLREFNATTAAYPREKLVHELFEEQVARSPEAIALVYEEERLTYAELNGRANQLGHYLVKQGMRPAELVAICMERCVEMVVGLLGILKAGGVYVPLDPSYPRERLGYLLKDARPRWVLTQAMFLESLPETQTMTVCLDLACNAIASEADDNLNAKALGLRSDHLVYVIYTSGSTGEPKGVMNEHGGVVNRLQWMQAQYGIGDQDRVLQKTPYSFDVSVWEFFWPLLNGAGLVVARPQGHQDPHYLSQLIAETGITVVHFVPSMLRVFLEHARAEQCHSLMHVVCSGEELSWEGQQRCFERLPWVRLHNLYGPTEAAIDVTYWECRAEKEATRIPIGRPISNTQIYILDQNRQPVPMGIIGEIHIGGKGVARGYLNRPELTAERFVRDPFSSAPEARMYKTGDLGRWRADGNIEYLGRNDHQVKIRGFRVELGEIESVLQRCDRVRDAVVMEREDVQGEKWLMAYVSGESERLSVERLREQMKLVLPRHMMPAGFVVMEKLPLTPNGKVDRKALALVDVLSTAREQYEAPQGEIEQLLAKVWQELLRVERVGRNDNFFDLGGHSLALTQMSFFVRESFGVTLSLVKLYEMQELKTIAAYIDHERAGGSGKKVAIVIDLDDEDSR